MPNVPEGWEAGPPPDPTLKDVSQRESGNRNLPPTANYAYPNSRASSEYQFEPGTWRMATKATGIGTQYPEAYLDPFKNERTINAEWLKQKYGVNSSVGWKASAPRGGYKDKAIPEGWQAGPAPKNPVLPPGWQVGVAPKPQMGPPQQGSPQLRSGPGRTATGPLQPTTPGQAAGAEAQAMQQAPGAKLAQWLGMKAAHGYDWAKNLSPNLINDAMGDAQDWGLNKMYLVLTGMFKAAGSENPETHAHNATSFLYDLSMFRAGEMGGRGERAGLEAVAAKAAENARAGEAGTGIPHIPGETVKPGQPPLAVNQGPKSFLPYSPSTPMVKPPSNDMGAMKQPIEGSAENAADALSLRMRITQGMKSPGVEHMSAPANENYLPGRTPESVSAAATPVHEILAANVRAKETTLGATDPTWGQSMRRAGNALKSIWAPETMKEVDTGEQLGKEAAANIREKIGINEREKQISAQALNQYYKMFNGVTPEEGLAVIRWLQKDPGARSEGGYEPTPETSSFMNAFRKEMKGMERALQSLPKLEGMQFKQNFVTQMWQNPEATLANLTGGKDASNYFTKKSVWDSYDDGIQQGGIPISTNPLEIGLRYINNARNLITQYQIIDAGLDHNPPRIVYRNPGNGPTGWAEMKGRAEYYKGPNLKAYAPQTYAQVYNNYTSVLPQGAGGDLLAGIQRVSNAATMVNLGLSGFHASLMMQESMASGIANAIDRITHGNVLTGAAKMGEAVVPGVYAATSLWRARQGIETYFNKEAGNLRTQKAVKALVAANFRMKGRGNITDEYRTSFLPDLVTSFRTGRMKMEAAQATADIIKHPITGTGRQIASLVFRTLDTASAPIFQYMVPRLKTGAALDMMYSYMKRKPDASDMELAAYARQVSDTIDNRFGEMNHDNIFLHKLQKVVMQSAVVSYSYEYGSARAAAGAVGDTANFHKGGWTPQMSYPIALFMSMAIHSGIYQYLMTGRPPGSVRDVTNPQTGGTDPKSGQPGRATLPNQLNQAFGFMNDSRSEATNKLNVLWKTAWDLWGATGLTGGYDYRNDPIIDRNAPGLDQMAQEAYYAMHSFAPISVTSVFGQSPPGSTIPSYQRAAGVRDAPHRAVDPEGNREALRRVNAEKAVKKRQHDGELPAYLPHNIFNKEVLQEMNRYGGTQQ